MNRQRRIPLILFGLGIIVLVAVPYFYGRQYPQSVVNVFEDIVTLGHLSCFVGFLSDLGIVLWFAMAVLFGQALHRRTGQREPISGPEFSFYLIFGSMALWLGLDDRLLIHEWLTVRYGVPEWLLMGVYGLTVLAAGLRFRDFLVEGDLFWAWLAFPSFVLSILLDLGVFHALLDARMTSAGQEVLEESFKWIGICALFLYVFTLTAVLPDERLRSRES